MFKRKEKVKQNLLESFGSVKTGPFDFDTISLYFNLKKSDNALQTVSDKVKADLDIDELFRFIDRTSSPIGQQYLYYKLRTIPARQSVAAQNSHLIEQLGENTLLRLRVQLALEKLKGRGSYYIASLIHEQYLNPPQWFFMVKLLALMNLIIPLMAFYNPGLLGVLPFVWFVNAALHVLNKRNLNRYVSSLPELLRLQKTAKELYKEPELQSLSPQLPKAIEVLDKIKRSMSFFNLEAKLQSDAEALFWGFLEVFKIIFLLEPLLLFGVLKRLETRRKEMEEAYVFVGQADMLLSVASLRKGVEQYCIPEIHESEKGIFAEEVYHPLIENCVKNSIDTSSSSILLTGSNMSGKTSFIRSIGINALCALTIDTCFAERFALPRLKLYSAIRISDDLLNDRSYYFEEVLSIKDMIEQSRTNVPALFLLDEIFKGTNTVERIAAGKAVLDYLSREGNIVFVSTHDIELAELLKGRFHLYHFSETVEQQTVSFDYKIKPGMLTRRNAIRILEINGYPQEIIEEAVALSKMN